LKIKHLRNVGKALKIKRFTVCGKLAERMRKICGKKQILENQALAEFLSAFPHNWENISQRPAPYPTDRPVSQLARFLQARSLAFLYIYT
jgi:hypothetical protein